MMIWALRKWSVSGDVGWHSIQSEEHLHIKYDENDKKDEAVENELVIAYWQRLKELLQGSL